MSMSPNMGSTGLSAGRNNTGAKLAGSKPPNIQWGKSKGGYKSGQMQQFTPEQMQLFQQMFGHLGPDSFLGRLAGGDESQFQEMEAPAWKQFQGIQGGLASRFSGEGTGARRSSGFQNTMNQAGSDFAQSLQSNRMNIRNQAIKDLMGMSSDLLDKKPYEQFLMKKDPSFWKQLLMGAMNQGSQFASTAGNAAIYGAMM